MIEAWDNPGEVKFQRLSKLTGKATHAWFLMAGSANTMKGQLDNGIILIEYPDGSEDSLLLRNPETWWRYRKIIIPMVMLSG